MVRSISDLAIYLALSFWTVFVATPAYLILGKLTRLFICKVFIILKWSFITCRLGRGWHIITIIQLAHGLRISLHCELMLDAGTCH